MRMLSLVGCGPARLDRARWHSVLVTQSFLGDNCQSAGLHTENIHARQKPSAHPRRGSFPQMPGPAKKIADRPASTRRSSPLRPAAPTAESTGRQGWTESTKTPSGQENPGKWPLRHDHACRAKEPGRHGECVFRRNQDISP